MAEIAAALDEMEERSGLDIGVHVDAASGGFIAPFLDPDLVWDFRLPRVQSINASGHKFGLVYPGVGWALWRDAAALPDELVFSVSYLGGEMPTFTLNFSRPGAQVVGQYYNFLRLGAEGYRAVQAGSRATATWLSGAISELGPFDLLSTGGDIPAFAFRLSDGAGYSVYDLSDELRTRGWIVPAYTMPPAIEDMAVLRVVVRNGFSRDLAGLFLADLRAAVERLARRGMEADDGSGPASTTEVAPGRRPGGPAVPKLGLMAVTEISEKTEAKERPRGRGAPGPLSAAAPGRVGRAGRGRHRVVQGTVAFVDISGFTKLSERLATHGKIGAEALTETIDRCFVELLGIASANGGQLIKFGGDALLLLFTGEGQALRACRAVRRHAPGPAPGRPPAGARPPRGAPDVGGGAQWRLRLLPRRRIPPRTHGHGARRHHDGEDGGDGRGGRDPGERRHRRPAPSGDPRRPQGRGHAAAPGPPHRRRLVLGSAVAGPGPLVRPRPAFSRWRSAGPCRPASGSPNTGGRWSPSSTSTAPTRCSRTHRPHEAGPDPRNARVEDPGRGRPSRRGFLSSDIDGDGGKIILTSGVPLAVEDAEDRMLRAVRDFVDAAGGPVSVRVGIHRAPLFVGEIGPPERRSFTVMGDGVNLAARVMAKARQGQILCTDDVLERTRLSVEADALAPFMVKGKARPVTAYSVGAIGETREPMAFTSAPFVGRVAESDLLAAALDEARRHRRSVAEVVGEPGVGKTRLVGELRAAAGRCPAHRGGVRALRLRHPLPGRPPAPSGRSRSRPRHRSRRRGPAAGRGRGAGRPGAPAPAAPPRRGPRHTGGRDAGHERARGPLPPPPHGLDRGRAPAGGASGPDPLRLRGRPLHGRRLGRDPRPPDHGRGRRALARGRRPPRRRGRTGGARGVGDPDPAGRPGPGRGPEPGGPDDGPGAPAPPHGAVPGRAVGGQSALPHRDRGRRARRAPTWTSCPTRWRPSWRPGSTSCPPPTATSCAGRRCSAAASPPTSSTPWWTTPSTTTSRSAWPGSCTGRATTVRFTHALLRESSYDGLPYRLRRELHARAGEAILGRAADSPEDQSGLLSLHFLHAQRYPEAHRFAVAAAERGRGRLRRRRIGRFLRARPRRGAPPPPSGADGPGRPARVAGRRPLPGGALRPGRPRLPPGPAPARR